MVKKLTILLDLAMAILLVAATILLYWFIWTAMNKAPVANTEKEIPGEVGEMAMIQGNSIVGVSAPFYPKVQILATITAYNPVPEQTDDDPYIMASGKKVYEGAIACPRDIPFGTKIEIGGEIYRCEDRLNKKYDGRFDILMFDEEEAKNFGKQTKEIIIH